MDWLQATPAEIERRLELLQKGTIKIQQANNLTLAAIDCRETNWVRAGRLERYADRLRARAHAMIQGVDG